MVSKVIVAIDPLLKCQMNHLNTEPEFDMYYRLLSTKDYNFY